MKTVFITGANRGLGKGFVEYFLKNGFQVFAGVRNIKSINPIPLDDPNLIPIAIDINDDESIKSAFLQIQSKTKSLDYLINNAGLNKDSATQNHKELVCNLQSLDRESLLKMFNTNTISPLIVTKHFLPLLIGNPTFIINISSARGSYNDENPNTNGNYGYRASKTALNMMTHCSLFDLPQNIKTYTVHPGSVKTDMNPTGSDLPITQAEKIVKISKNWDDKFNGKFLRFDGTIYPL